jgi:hypothetical protein
MCFYFAYLQLQYVCFEASYTDQNNDQRENLMVKDLRIQFHSNTNSLLNVKKRRLKETPPEMEWKGLVLKCIK